MVKEKKTRKSTTKKTKKAEKVGSKVGVIEKMGTNSAGQDIYRKFVTENSFVLGLMINDEFTQIK